MNKEKIFFTPKFEIGQYVYHKTPDSDMGIVLDIFYSVFTGAITSVDQMDCIEYELCEDKMF